MAAIAISSIAHAQKFVGGDISLLPEYEEAGAIYKDHAGKPASSALALFQAHGMNAMRVRLFVNPSQYTEPDKDPNACQDLEMVKKLGKRIKAQGMSFMLDFHYSDTWADPAKQWTPKEWVGMSDSQLKEKIYEYTKSVLTQLNEAGVTPDLIETGNEISYGMLWGTRTEANNNDKNRCWKNAPEANWNRFADLLKNAGKACREVCPNAKIILHIERVSSSTQQDNKGYGALRYFYDEMKHYGIDYDIIGLSYYPYFHGTIGDLEGAIGMLEKNFSDKKIMIMEFGYPYAWQVPGTNYDYTSRYPYSEEGQRAVTADLISMLNKHPQVNGLFWWWMEYNAYNTSIQGWYNAPLFDSRTGRATAAFDEMGKFNGTAAAVQPVTNQAGAEASAWYTLDGKRLPKKPSQEGVYINNKKKWAFQNFGK